VGMHLATNCLFAAPAKNPAEPALLKKGFFIPETSPVSCRVEYEGNITSNARMKQIQEGSGKVDNFEILTNLGMAVFNIENRFDLYGGLGAATIQSNWRFQQTGSNIISRVDTESNNRLAWSIGANATIFEWDSAFIGGGIRYSGAHANLSWITINGVNIPTQSAEFRWLQWQAQAALGCQIGFFTPYLGAKYNNARARLQTVGSAIAADGEGKIHMENKNRFGVYLGVTLTNGEYFMMTLEGRIIDEEAVSVSGDIRF